MFYMGDIGDGQKAEVQRGADQGCDHHQHAISHYQSGCDRKAYGYESFRANNEDRDGRNRARYRVPTTGGMLRQLIADEVDQLAEIEEDLSRLRRKQEKCIVRRKHYEEMLQELEQRIIENP